MFCKLPLIVVTVKIITIEVIRSQYLESGLNDQKPTLEKNNIVNKGVWIRNKDDENDMLVKANPGNFIFRENSMDVDNLLQNNFDAFGGSYMQETPFIPAYTDRQKRSSRYKRPRKSITGKNIKSNEYERSDSAQSKIINNLKPSLVFNDYPYEVAILLKGNISSEKDKSSAWQQDTANNETTNTTTINNFNNSDTVDKPTTVSIDTEIKNSSNETIKNITSQKRSMKYDFETEIIKKIEYTEDLNKTEENNTNDNKINDRNVFDKDNSEWHQTAPIPDVNIYKVVPKEPMQKSKPVTERGLLKVISMLTKTFKKIIKHHGEIKDIHSRINDISDEFRKNIDSFTGKFQDFDLKYLYLLKLHDKMKEFDSKLDNREQYFLNKEKEIAKGFKEFEYQQKKFLLQQKQFYNIQKLMLAQNEKINLKQNLIAKTQSEISHRQNNFARILKKAKQLYTDNRNTAITKLSSSISKLKDATQKPHEPQITQTNTQAPESTTESVKINLFSIPTSNKIQQDPDEFILKEKDEQAIDDLVYKYYFNNTFIDSFMKSKILNSFMGDGEHSGNTRTAKNKRNNFETTILLPVLETNESAAYGRHRQRRWINRHHSRHQLKRKDYKKTTPNLIVATTDKTKYVGIPIQVKVPLNVVEGLSMTENNNKSHPFLTMARHFCNEIHQNANQQMLGWCIEKALRKLQFLEAKMVQQPLMPNNIMPPKSIVKTNDVINDQEKPLNKEKLYINEHIVKKILPTEIKSTSNDITETISTKLPGLDTTTSPPVQLTSLTLQTINTAYTNVPAEMKISPDTLHFPDNDELELKLKEYELEPDTQGNVYYEGSVHASDLLDNSESGEDDFMPGLDSNSRVEVDPIAFDLQAKRRASVRKLNENIKTKTPNLNLF